MTKKRKLALLILAVVVLAGSLAVILVRTRSLSPEERAKVIARCLDRNDTRCLYDSLTDRIKQDMSFEDFSALADKYLYPHLRRDSQLSVVIEPTSGRDVLLTTTYARTGRPPFEFVTEVADTGDGVRAPNLTALILIGAATADLDRLEMQMPRGEAKAVAFQRFFTAEKQTLEALGLKGVEFGSTGTFQEWDDIIQTSSDRVEFFRAQADAK